MRMESITWQHPKSKGDRNEAIYEDYKKLLAKGFYSYEVQGQLSSKYELSPQRIYTIYQAMLKKVKKLEK